MFFLFLDIYRTAKKDFVDFFLQIIHRMTFGVQSYVVITFLLDIW